MTLLQTCNGPRHQYRPLRCDHEPADKASTRNSMAIRNLLNPTDGDGQRVDVRSPSSNADSEDANLTPASSPGTTCSSHTDATTWTAQSGDRTTISPGSHTGTMVSAENQWSKGTAATEVTMFVAAAKDRPTRCIAGKSCTGKKKRKEYRRPYTEEQVMWLWFFKIDVQMKWDDVLEKYNVDWPKDQREKGGTQCKFYRLAAQYGLPKMRQMKGSPKYIAHRYGMWPMMRRSYRWMDPCKHMLPGQSTLNDHTLSGTNMSTGYLAGGPYYGST